MSSARATVVIATRNRKDELRVALTSCFAQSVPVEVIVLDDASSDGTFDLVKNEFPLAIVKRSETPQGCIVARNHGARLATAPYVFSIDDDALFSSPAVVEQTLRDFDDPHIAVVAIPLWEPNSQQQLLQRAPSAEKTWVTAQFKGTSYAVKRELFLALGGFRETLVHQGEEADFTIRLMESGYFVRMGTADPIQHNESPKRDLSRMDYYGCRNLVLFAWQNVPIPHLLIHLPATTIKAILFTLQPTRLLVRASGIAHAYTSFLKTARMPVSCATYRRFRMLWKRGASQLNVLGPAGASNLDIGVLRVTKR